MILVEAVPQVYGYLTPSGSLVTSLGQASPGNGLLLANAIIISQLVFGSYLVFLMDEVVSKWGIGSGISLFIAAGVSQQIVQGTLNWVPQNPTLAISATNPPSGAIPKSLWFFTHYSASQMASGGWEQVLLRQPNPIVALIGTAAIFFLVAWTESTRIELPLSHAEARGARGRYPLRLIYASNIPVILMSALLANVSLFSILLWSNATLSHFPVFGHQWWVGSYPSAAQATHLGVSQTQPLTGGAYYLSTVNGLEAWLLPILNFQTYGGFLYGHAWWQGLLHVGVYFSAMVFGSILFARFWIQTTNMGPEAVAREIRGLRDADPRVPSGAPGAPAGPRAVHPRHHHHLGRRRRRPRGGRGPHRDARQCLRDGCLADGRYHHQPLRGDGPRTADGDEPAAPPLPGRRIVGC